MGEMTAIAWCHHTFNPWWGCVEVSPGCTNCYARTFSNRVGRAKWGKNEDRKIASEKVWRDPIRWNADAGKAGERRRVFCASMADVFEDRRDLDSQRSRLWSLIEITPWLDWLILTKRPGAMLRMWPWKCGRANVWAGTTAEDQVRADERIPILLNVPAALHFVSAEPLLGPIDFRRHSVVPPCVDYMRTPPVSIGTQIRPSWIIAGGESGPGARPCYIDWISSIIDQCREAGVACFTKQLGSNAVHKSALGRHYWLGRVKHPKAGDMSEWPTDLRVRQFPEVHHASA